MWSTVSLSAAAVMGVERFSEFLAGAAAMDRHFQAAPLAENLPVLAALTGDKFTVARLGIYIAPHLMLAGAGLGVLALLLGNHRG